MNPAFEILLKCSLVNALVALLLTLLAAATDRRAFGIAAVICLILCIFFAIVAIIFL